MHIPHNFTVHRQQGAALIVGLLLLLVLTVLGLSGMNSASLELIMAGNEQFRNNAQQAAQTGTELTIQQAATDPGDILGTTDVLGNVIASLTSTGNTIANSNDAYDTKVTYVGDGNLSGYTMTSGSTAYTALYYTIETTGYSARGAQSTTDQTVFIVAQK